jgi:hypothetical protein
MSSPVGLCDGSSLMFISLASAGDRTKSGREPAVGNFERDLPSRS